MAAKPEQIGEDKKFVCFRRQTLAYIKKTTSRWRRRKWRLDPEAYFPKYKGWAG